MFQNLSGGTDVEYDKIDKYDNKIKMFLKNAFTRQNIIVYIVSFMLSMVECANTGITFSIAIFAACLSNKIPAIVVYFLTLIGTLVGNGVNSFLTYLLTSFVFIVMLLIFKPKESDEYKSETIRLGKYVFISSFLVQALSMLFNNFMLYDLLSSIMIAISSYIFYKIFANSLIVIHKFGIKSAFAIEEVIGASIILAICATSFRELSIFGFQIKTILTILIVLVLGWTNGILVGATSGVTIGTILGLISGSEPIIIASYAISGMIAGVFSRFGKIGVIIGFILGNGILTYVTNGNVAQIIYIKEILIASLGLLLVPSTIKINIEELFRKIKIIRSRTCY